jgi:hypothetical protein
MKYARFEDLPVWQAAVDLALRAYELTKRPEFRRPGDLADQLRRAALSVSNNIAEGFERGTTAELLSFLYIARGSASEDRVQRADLSFPGGAWECTPRGTIAKATFLISNLKSEISAAEHARPAPAEISNLKSEISNLIALAESCSRQLRAWADKLQNSDITGQRHLTEKSKHIYESKKRADAFWKQCEAVVQKRIEESSKARRSTLGEMTGRE